MLRLMAMQLANQKFNIEKMVFERERAWLLRSHANPVTTGLHRSWPNSERVYTSTM
jgi:hypothetical protein